MSEDRLSITMTTAHEGHPEMLRVWRWCKSLLKAGQHVHIEARKSTRSIEQNSKFHAICDDVAKSGAKWAGKTRTASEWKVLFVSGHGIATKEGSDIVPGLESEFVNLRESTARMTVARSSSLIEYTLAWCANNDVRLPMYERESEGGAA